MSERCHVTAAAAGIGVFSVPQGVVYVSQSSKERV